MKGPAGVLALVLAETVGGATVYLFLTPLWNEVRRGFFKLCGFIILPLAVAMWAGVAVAREPGNHAAQWALWLSIAFTFATALWLLLLFFRRLQPVDVGEVGGGAVDHADPGALLGARLDRLDPRLVDCQRHPAPPFGTLARRRPET